MRILSRKPYLAKSAVPVASQPMDPLESILQQCDISLITSYAAGKSGFCPHTGRRPKRTLFDNTVFQCGKGMGRKCLLWLYGTGNQGHVSQLYPSFISRSAPAFFTHQCGIVRFRTACPGKQVVQAFCQQPFEGRAFKIRIPLFIDGRIDIIAAGNAVAGTKNSIRVQFHFNYKGYSFAHRHPSSQNVQWSAISIGSNSKQISSLSTFRKISFCISAPSTNTRRYS